MTEEVVTEETAETIDEETGEVENDVTAEETEEIAEEVAEESTETTGEENAEEVVEETETEEIVEETEEQQTEEVEESAEEETGNPTIEIEMSSKNSSIYKGYLYANITSDLKYETAYNTIETLNITDGKYIDSIRFVETENIALDGESKLAIANQIYYKKTSISVEEFENILGEEGEIKIYVSDGTYVGSITTETEVVNNSYVYTYESNYSELIFDISSPVGDGLLSISNDKAIKGDATFTREQVSRFTSIATTLTITMDVGEESAEVTETGYVSLEETESKMTIEIDNDVLSTEYENEVSINIALKTDEEKYELFQNPTIEIEFPAAVKEAEVTNINLLYKNGLSLNTWEVYTNDEGRVVLKITLTGSQSVYTPGSATEGTTVAVDLTLSINRLTTNGTQNLKLRYTNEATDRISYELEGKEAEILQLNFTGKEEIITAITAKNQTTGDSVTTYDSETETTSINAEGESQTVTITGTVLDNFESTIKNVYIIGQIPTSGNANVDGTAYGSNIDSTLISAIEVSGLDATVYYSTEVNPTVLSDSWTEDTSDLSNYKSYKIVINNTETNIGEYIRFSYNIEISENIGYNVKTYADYTTYYMYGEQDLYKIQAVSLASEEKELTIDDIDENNVEEVTNEDVENTTSDEIKVTIGSQVSQGGTVLSEDDSIYERQIVRYTIVIQNDSDVALNNVVLKCNAANANLYYMKVYEAEDYYGYDVYYSGKYEEDVDGEQVYETFTIDSLAVGESQSFEFQVIALENVNEIYGIISVACDEFEETTIETSRTSVEEALLEVRSGYAYYESLMDGETDCLVNTEFLTDSYVKNIGDTTLSNIQLSVIIPSELEYKDTYIIYGADNLEFNVSKSDNNTVITFYIDSLESGEEKEISISTNIKEFDTSISSKTVTILTVATVNDISYTSNDYKKTVNQSFANIEYDWNCDTNKETVENGDILTFTLEVANTGVVDSGFIFVNSELPSGFVLTSLIKQNSEGSLSDITSEVTDSGISDELSLDAGEDVTYLIQVSVDESLYEVDQDSVEMKASVYGQDCDIETDVISFKINNTLVGVLTEDEEDSSTDISSNDSDSSSSDTNSTTDDKNNDSDSSSSSNSISSTSDSSDSSSSVTTTSDDETSSESSSSTTTTYRISGQVWLDTDKDGIKSDAEGIEGVTVALYGTYSDGGIDTSKEYGTATTDEDGYYSFIGIEKGTYVITFAYDDTTYSVTAYQVSTATTSENSDAFSKTLSTGEKVAITDALTVNGLNLTNIDLGLVLLKVFDLSLEKYVSNITVTNNSGTTNYTYTSKSDTKLEISQRYYTSTTLEITYEIVITNEGDVSGYVNKIADYLPEEATINTEKSSNWYYGEDGGIYCSELVGTEIESGGSKSVTLTVEVSLESGEAMSLVNGAEIVESTNALGLIDEDSTTGNEDETEDDYGKSTITVSIATGNLARNIISIIIIIACAVVIIIEIKKNKTKKVYR